MDVSKKDKTHHGEVRVQEQEHPLEPLQSEGAALLEEVASLTGLPPEWVQAELGRILGTAGQNHENLTLDELRGAMLKYLDEMQGHLAEQEAADLVVLEQMAIPGSTLNH